MTDEQKYFTMKQVAAKLGRLIRNQCADLQSDSVVAL